MRGFELLAFEDREGERVWSVRVGHDCPFFEGHFDGRPILPAVAELALVQALASDRSRETVTIAAITNLRFRTPIEPGEEFDVHLGAAREDGSSRLHIRSGLRIVASGTVATSSVPRIAPGDA